MEMGYEIKLIIGRDTGRKEDDCDYSTTPPRKSGKKCTYFMEYAMIDLCKLAYDGVFHKAMGSWRNKDENHFWFKYEANDRRLIEDCYGEKWIPQKISVVLDVLKQELANDPDYRRLKWAVALLESMKDDAEDLCVWVYGY